MAPLTVCGCHPAQTLGASPLPASMGSAVILSGMVDRLRAGSQHYRYQEGVRLREGVVFSTLKYGGITFENYRGWIGGGTDAGDTMTPFIDPNEAHCFPLGTPNLFKTFFGPVDYIEPVSTLGLPCYAKAIPFDNNKSIRLKMQINRSHSAGGHAL